jgi:hypothetical protein
MINYAIVLRNIKKLNESEKVFYECLEIYKLHFPKDLFGIGLTKNNLANVLLELNKLDEAE